MRDEFRSGISQLWGQIMLCQRQEMPFIQTAPHILDPNHWDLELLDAALPVTAQVIHTAGDYKRALEKIKAGQKIHCSSLLTFSRTIAHFGVTFTYFKHYKS